MAVVAPDPMPCDAVRRRRFEQRAPQIGILDWLLVGGEPAALLPGVDPLRDPVDHIFAVRIEIDPAWLLQGAQRFDHRGHFHAVVGRFALASDKLAFAAAIPQHRAPAARPGVALARSVGEDFDRFHAPLQPANASAPVSRYNWSRLAKSIATFRVTSGWGGVLSQSSAREEMKRMQAPRASTGSALRSYSKSGRIDSYPASSAFDTSSRNWRPWLSNDHAACVTARS